MTAQPISSKLRRIVMERAKGCCEYCKSQEIFATQSLSVEHIIPIAKNGTSTSDNLALACQGCNNRKYNRTEAYDPIDGQLAPLYHPRQQSRAEHFIWSDDFTELIGISPTGRATVVRLQLNREGVVNLRQLLSEKNLHPPSA